MNHGTHFLFLGWIAYGSSITVYSILLVVEPKNYLNNVEVGIWFCNDWLIAYCVAGSYKIVGWFVGIGMFIWFNCIAIGVNGWIISVSSPVKPPVVFCKFISPFCTILSISYLAIQHKSYVPEIVKTFRFFLVC